MADDAKLRDVKYEMGVPGDQPEDKGGELIFLDGGTVIKSEGEMSEGANHAMDNGEPEFKYDPARHGAAQEGQGQGGYGG